MRFILLLTIIFLATFLGAQSPTDLNHNVGKNATYWANNVQSRADIEAIFNDARRSEEQQLGLANNSIGQLQLPNDWANYTADERMLFLMNAERTCRAGVNYGAGAVLGLPFQGVEASLDAAAQAHADYLVASNTFSHTGDNNSSPWDRIDNAVGAACTEFMSYGENLACFFTSGSSNNFVVEHAVYNWIYEDSTSDWGHRRAALIQDVDAYGGNGFTNNYGVAVSEGFIGVGLATSATYNPFGFSNVAAADVVTFSVFDPAASSNCNYVDLLTGLVPSLHKNEINVYPNPTTAVLYVDYLEVGAMVKLYNQLGQCVFSGKALDRQLEINLSHLAKGIYIVETASTLTKVVLQ